MTTITLLSHPGSRGLVGYGPVEHEAVTDAVPLVSWTLLDGFLDRDVTTTLVELDDGLWCRRPLTEALSDVEIDGTTVRFDGDLPDDGGCYGPVVRLDAEHLYTPFRAGTPLLTIGSVRGGLGGTFPRARLVFWSLGATAGDARAVADGQVPDRSRTVTLPVPGDERRVLTLLEAHLLPQDVLGDLRVTVHDEDAARRRLDPSVFLAGTVEHRRVAAEKARDKLVATAARIEAVLASGEIPEHYHAPSSGSESVYDHFGVSTRAVDSWLAGRVLLDLFSRPARQSW